MWGGNTLSLNAGGSSHKERAHGKTNDLTKFLKAVTNYEIASLVPIKVLNLQRSWFQHRVDVCVLISFGIGKKKKNLS